jgi:hypothetical protein
MVLNLDDSTGSGSHWVALFAVNQMRVYYFDSFGQAPSGVILHYLQDKYQKITFNNTRLQSLLSNVCGHYCIYVIYHMSIGLDFITLLKCLYNLNNPDFYVKAFVNKFCC